MCCWGGLITSVISHSLKVVKVVVKTIVCDMLKREKFLKDPCQSHFNSLFFS